MLKQQAIMKTVKHLQLPLWKRLMLVTVLFLSTGLLALMASTQDAYASAASQPRHTTHGTQKGQSPLTIVIVCNPGNGGKGKHTQQKGIVSGNICTGTTPINLHLTLNNTVNICNAGLGGKGGLTRLGTTGAGGGTGGDCLIYGDKGETGGTFTGHSSGGTISFGH